MFQKSIAAGRGRFGVAARAVSIVAIVVAVGAGVAVNAQEHGPGGHGGPPGGMMMGGPPEHMVRMMDHLLDGLGATDAQRTQIRQIAMAAAGDLKAQHQAERGLRDKAAQIFTSPSVDASAAENLRQQMLTQQDQASKRIMQAMLDISRVLTPEQRVKLGERMKDHQAIMEDRMKRMQPGGPGARPKP